MKREHAETSTALETERGRVKRRREDGASSEIDVTMSDPVASGAEGDVKEQGMRLWQTIKDAVNKE